MLGIDLVIFILFTWQNFVSEMFEVQDEQITITIPVLPLTYQPAINTQNSKNYSDISSVLIITFNFYEMFVAIWNFK